MKFLVCFSDQGLKYENDKEFISYSKMLNIEPIRIRIIFIEWSDKSPRFLSYSNFMNYGITCPISYGQILSFRSDTEFFSPPEDL